MFMNSLSQSRDLLTRPKSCIACSLSIRCSCLSEDCSILAVAEQIPSLMQCQLLILLAMLIPGILDYFVELLKTWRCLQNHEGSDQDKCGIVILQILQH